MNNWKELKINNVLSDILTGKYEFEYLSKLLDRWNNICNFQTLGQHIDLEYKIRYRKSKSKPSTEGS